MSFRESFLSLTSESATAPPKALAVLAMRIRSLARMGSPLFRLRTPKAWTFLCWPRCTTAMTLGGPPAVPGDEGPEGTVERRVWAFFLGTTIGRAGGGHGERHPACKEHHRGYGHQQ